MNFNSKEIKQSPITQIFITKEYNEFLHQQNQNFLHYIQQLPLSFQQEFLIQFCKFIGIEITSKIKLNSFHQMNSFQIQFLLNEILTKMKNEFLSNELFYFHCVYLTRSFPEIFPSFFSQLDLNNSLFHLLTIVKIMDYWKEMIDERMTPRSRKFFNEIMKENGIEVDETIKKTIEMYKKNMLMKRRELFIIFNVFIEMIHFDLLKVCFLLCIYDYF